VVRNRLLVHPGDLADPKKIQMSNTRLVGQIFERTGPGAPHVQLTKVEPQSRPESPKISQAANTVRGQKPDLRNESSSFLLAQSDPATAPFGGAASDPLMFEPPPGILQPDFFATESQTGRLSFGVGVNSNSGPVGSIVLEENNFDIL